MLSSEPPSEPSGFMFYCSEVAACIGNNKYKKRWEAFEAVFKRFHGGRYYSQAVERLRLMGFNIITTDQKIDQLAKNAQSIDAKSVINDFLKKPASTSCDLQQAIETFEFNMVAEGTRFKDRKTILKESLEKQLSKEQQLTDQYNEIVQNSGGDDNDDERKICRNDPGALRDGELFVSHIHRSTKVPTPKPTAVDPAAENLQKELAEVRSARKRTTEDLQLHEKEWTDFKVAKSELIRQKQTAFGRDKEDVLIQSGAIGTITCNNSELYTALLGSEPMRWGICGRIDGFRDGQLIEIKNRKSHIYNPLPIYDVIQVQCYLQILGIDQATLIQSLSHGDGTFQTEETVIVRDDDLWQEHILPGLQIMIAILDDFCRDKLLQDQYFQTPDAKKTFFMNKMSKKHEKVNKITKPRKPEIQEKPQAFRTCEKSQTETKPQAHDKSKITSFFSPH